MQIINILAINEKKGADDFLYTIGWHKVERRCISVGKDKIMQK